MFVSLSFRCWWGSRNFEFSIYVDGFEFLVVVVVVVWGLGCDGGGFVWMLVCLAVGRGVDGGRFCHHHHNCPAISRKKRPRSGFDLGLVFLNKRFLFWALGFVSKWDFIWVWCFQIWDHGWSLLLGFFIGGLLLGFRHYW